MLAHDPVEDTEKYKRAMKEIRPKLEREFENVNGLGTCHLVWRRQKELLRAYGIEWKTPVECNPMVIFD